MDYKTGRHLLTVDDARSSLALALYALAAQAGCAAPATGSSCTTCPPAEVLAWEHTAESLARQLGRAEDIAAECAAADERMGRDGCRSRPLRGVPAAPRPVLRLVRLPAALPGRRRPPRPRDAPGTAFPADATETQGPARQGSPAR